MFNTGKFIKVLALLIATWMVAATVSAQVTTSTVTGTVKDAQGAVIPGAAVVLISETKGTQLSDVFSNSDGDFTFANVPGDRYTVQVTMEGFKTSKRTGLVVDAGARIGTGPLTLDVGGLTDTVQVKAEAPLVQAQSGERSYTVSREAVENLPIANRSFTALAFLAPGVTMDGNNTPQRIGGGGDPNIMMDGVSAMDTGSNRPLLQMNIESIAEVKVLTSNYQAEYGRASGVQVTAVTKSGSNQFRGSLYDVQRDSDWNSNTKVNKLNGDPKTVLKEKDLGYSIGGPVGKPGGSNKLFFFYSQEFSPRTAGNDVRRYRMPTALERAGDFSQTTDNNGNPYPYIKDPLSPDPCTAANTAGCFQAGGAVGRIPQDRLYSTGLAILNQYPLPNIDNVPALQNYNYQITRPNESILSTQPAIRVDYQPTQKLRATVKYSAWMQRDHTFNGTIPGYNDTRMQSAPVSSYTTSINYTMSPTTFIEATYGHSQNELAGCAQAQSGTGAIFCNSADGTQGVQVTSAASLAGAGLSNLPFLFPNATVLDPNYYAVQALNEIDPAFWDGTRVSKVPRFQWGGRVSNSPPEFRFPGWFNINSTHDLAISLTKVAGRHTIKTGFYNTQSFKAEQTSNDAFGTINFQQDTPGVNQYDTSFGFANAAIGTFSAYTQAERYAETAAHYANREAYIQDNWKVSNRFTMDYGLRFVHQVAQYDEFGKASNFLPDRYSAAAAPSLYVSGCLTGVTCSGSNRVAVNPLTGRNLGANSSLLIGTLVPGTGDRLNGLVLPGGDIPKATYTWPSVVVAPRFGAAYDLTGTQRLVIRGGGGLFYDRPSSTNFSGGVNNPPTASIVTAQYGQLQSLGGGGLTVVGPPSLNAIIFDAKIPSSTQWNVGVQTALPWATALDVSYVGQHSYNTFQTVNINQIDFGTAFLPQYQDPTLGVNATPGAAAQVTNLLRPIRGYGDINLRWDRGWRTYHSIQLSLNRRFRDGFSFGFNDTIGLSDKQQAGVRLQHNPDGSYYIRDDQGLADELLGNNNPIRHTMRANFVWDMPDLHAQGKALRAVGLVLNDWQLSGIWSASTGGAYAIGYSYQNGGGNTNLTGSTNYGGRVRIVGDPGAGCSSNPYQQYNPSAFQGPLVGSNGLESGNGYLKGCFQSVLDLAIARNIRLGGARNLQLRVDMFNAPNQAIITGRNTTINLASPTDPVTITNLPYDANGALIDSRSRPRNSGVGVATAYQNPRTVQAQIRFSF